MFICAKWKRLDDGCVARCDKEHRHAGDHVDSVIGIGWDREAPPSTGPTLPEEVFDYPKKLRDLVDTLTGLHGNLGKREAATSEGATECTCATNAISICEHCLSTLRARLAEVERERDVIANALRFEVEDGEYFIPAEPGPLGPFTLTEAVQNWMELVDKWDAEDRTKLAAAEARVEELEKVVHQLICKHKRISGGNDYTQCHDCELEWDYRKSTAEESAQAAARAALEDKR